MPAVRVVLDIDDLPDAARTRVLDALAAIDLQPVDRDGAEEADVRLCGPDAAPPEADDGPVVLAIHPQPDRAATSALIAAGVAGVVALEELEDTLGVAVQAVLKGLVVAPRETRDAFRRPVLTARERQVLSLVVLGLTNAEAARRLFVAESNVKYHLLSIYDKLGVRTRKEVTELVLDPRNGLSNGILGLGTSVPRRRTSGYAEPEVD